MRSRFWMPALVAMLMGGLSSATSVRPLSLEQLTTGADDIVYGKVEKVESFWKDQRIETNVTLRTFESWKGGVQTSVVVRVPGGTVDGITMKCSEAPSFRATDEVVCFLRTKDRMKEVYGWFRGQYTIVNGQVREMPNTSLAQLRATVGGITQAPPIFVPLGGGK